MPTTKIESVSVTPVTFETLEITEVRDIRATEQGFFADVLLKGAVNTISLPTNYNDWLTFHGLSLIESQYSDVELARFDWHQKACRANPSHIRMG